MGSPIGLAEARALIAEVATRLSLGQETVAVADALGRVLAEDLPALGDAPPFDSAAMDGWALRAGPAGRELRVIGESRAGAPFAGEVGGGEAVRISTGAALPAGADAVLRQEDASDRETVIVCNADVEPGSSVRATGSDIHAGSIALTAGTRLGPAELAVAVTAGAGAVTVGRRARVAVVVTGDELREPGAVLERGQIHNSNGTLLRALAERAGAVIVRGSPGAGPRLAVADADGETEAALAAALDCADVLVISGGVSVGPHDRVRPALAALGVRERFWRVALRPGGPTWFGENGARLVFGLPGNPASAAVTFALLVAPALAVLEGSRVADSGATAVLAEAFPRERARVHAVRVRLSERDGVRWATPTGPQDSHRTSSLLGADALALIEPGEGEAPAGSRVTLAPAPG